MGWVLIEVLMWRWAQRIFWVRLGRRLEEKRPRAPNYSLLLRRQRATHRGQALLCYSAVCTNTKLICDHTAKDYSAAQGAIHRARGKAVLYCTALHIISLQEHPAPDHTPQEGQHMVQELQCTVDNEFAAQTLCLIPCAGCYLLFRTLQQPACSKEQQRRQHVASKVEYIPSYTKDILAGERIYSTPHQNVLQVYLQGRECSPSLHQSAL